MEAANKLTWDSYDLENIRDAKDFLCNSISEDLERQLYEVCSEEDGMIESPKSMQCQRRNNREVTGSGISGADYGKQTMK